MDELSLEILSAFKAYLLPFIMSVFLAYIAYQQLITNRNKLKLDLYNKRFEVFTSSLRLYQELMADGSSFETNKDFINKKEAAKFLFSKDKSIYSLLDEMHTKSFKINHFKNDRDELAQNPESFKIASDSSLEAVKWFNFAIKELSKKLEPFLSL